jgi:integrase/recombinase XerC/integrase/recombinase XerD
MPVVDLREEMAAQYFQTLILSGARPKTFKRKLASVRRFFRYLNALKLAAVSADRLTELISAGAISPRPQAPKRFDEIEPLILRVFEFSISVHPSGELNDRLILERNRAFVITLADTGLRVHEICKLKRSDVDWQSGKGIVIGKGSKEGSIWFSDRSILAIKRYLSLRSEVDGRTNRPLGSLPLFARHDAGAGKKIIPISPQTGEAIVHDMSRLALGDEYDERLTCHKFRHYFVTQILRKTGNIKLAQEMARHANIGTTQHYGHVNEAELDRAHRDIFR